MTRIVAISDTHTKTKGIQVPDGDILIHSGDISFSGNVKELAMFNVWLQRLKHRFECILLVPGNHDWLFEKDPNLAKSLVPDAKVLIHEALEYKGLKIFGSPYTPEFQNWAFNVSRGTDLARKWADIPDDTQILITHGPAYGTGDLVPGKGMLGCEQLRQRIAALNELKAHFFGHIHEGYGKYQVGPVTYVNASICDGEYRTNNKPIILDI